MWNGGPSETSLTWWTRVSSAVSWAGGNSLLIPNTVDAESKWNDLRVREALNTP
jgi:hypothetical protein